MRVLNTLSRFFKKYYPSALVVCVILYATWLPGSLEPHGLPKIPHFDKLIHAIMFGGFAGAVIFDTRRSGTILDKGLIMRAGFIAAVFAAFDEYVQGLLPIDRPTDWIDFVADIVGIGVALLTAPYVTNRIFKNKN